jgi:hypothetical protein
VDKYCGTHNLLLLSFFSRYYSRLQSIQPNSDELLFTLLFGTVIVVRTIVVKNKTLSEPLIALEF